MDIVLMIDISGSMSGQKISSVSDALDNLKLNLVGYGEPKTPVKIAIELFSKEVIWPVEAFVPVEQFDWVEPFCTGMTSMGSACSSLAQFLTTNCLRDNLKIIMISDGCPTDDFDEGLSKLENTEAFQKSEKYAIAIGEEADMSALLKFTKDMGRIVKVTDMDTLSVHLTGTIMSKPIIDSPYSGYGGNDLNLSDEWS